MSYNNDILCISTAFIFAYFFRLLTSTDKYFNDSKDGNAEQETFDGSIKLQHVIVFVYGFLYVAGLTGTVAIYIYNREKYKKGNNGYFVILIYIYIYCGFIIFKGINFRR